MTLELPHSVGDEVYLLRYNEIVKMPIYKITVVIREDILISHFVANDTDSTVVNGNKLFKTKEALLASM